MSDHNCLLYRLERFDKDGVARYLLFRKADNFIPVTASLYEAYLYSRRKPKKGPQALFFSTWPIFLVGQNVKDTIWRFFFCPELVSSIRILATLCFG